MHIIIRSDDTNIHLPLPTGLIFNRLTASLAARTVAEYGVAMTSDQMYALIKAAKVYKHHHPDWVLVEVESADGEYVKIKL